MTRKSTSNKRPAPRTCFIAGAVFIILDPVFDHVWNAFFAHLPYCYKDAGRLFFLLGGVLFLIAGFILYLKNKRGSPWLK